MNASHLPQTCSALYLSGLGNLINYTNPPTMAGLRTIAERTKYMLAIIDPDPQILARRLFLKVGMKHLASYRGAGGYPVEVWGGETRLLKFPRPRPKAKPKAKKKAAAKRSSR